MKSAMTSTRRARFLYRHMIPTPRRRYAIDSAPTPSYRPTTTTTSTTTPTPSANPPNPSRTSSYYATFAQPTLKCFLGALFTYQLSYYAWMKLEAAEEAHAIDVEMAGLQQDLRDAVATAAAAAAAAAARKQGGIQDVMVGKEVQPSQSRQELEKRSWWWPWRGGES